MKLDRASFAIVAGTLLCATGIFTVDLMTPRGVAEWVAYLFPVLLTTRASLRWYPSCFAALCTLLIALGFFFSPPGIEQNLDLAGRAMGSLMVWITTHLLVLNRHAQDALRDSQALHASLVEVLPQYIFRKDLEGRFTFANQRFCTVLGKRLEEILGKSDADFFPKELAEKYRRDDQTIIETGQPLDQVEEHVTPTGDKLFVQVVKTSVRDAQGKVIGTQGIFWDVTDRKRAEEQLASERDLLRALLDNVPDRIYFKDASSRFLRCNLAMARRLGLSNPEGSIGKTDFDFHPKERAQEYLDDEQRIISTGQALINKVEEQTGKDGSQLWASVTKVPIRNREGVVTGIIGISRDITAQKKAEEELKRTAADLARSNIELEQFAYVASHDLQEPLRMVASYTQLLARRYQGQLDADAQEFIRYAADGANRMQQLINDLLTYSRVGSRGLKFQPVDACAALGQAIANLQGSIQEQGAFVTNDDLPIVQADGTQLAQLFQNLIGNAVKFHGPEPPRVHVSAVQKDLEWHFGVRDNGIGIDPQFYERIFVIFQRLHRQAEYPGTGIGLAICKKIVERHGGRIWVESRPGQGTTFCFALPITPNPELEQPFAKHETHPQRQTD